MMKHSSSLKALSFSLLVLVAACGGQNLEQESKPTFTVGAHGSGIYAGFVGHEVLTRAALQAAGKHISALGSAEIRKGLIALHGEVMPDDLRSSGFSSQNPLVLGNVHTDAPEDWKSQSLLPDLVDVFEREFGIPRAQNWHDGELRQQTHFLRNFSGTKLESARSACEGSLAKVTKLATLSVATMKAGDARSSLYLAGSALHTLQDSFSAAHVTRDAGNRGLQNVCIYGLTPTTNDVCVHTLVQTFPGKDDSIWRPISGSGAPALNGTAPLALKDTALAAIRYSAGFLRVLSRLYASSDAVEPSLAQFFKGTSPLVEADAQGAWDCSTLSSAEGSLKP